MSVPCLSPSEALTELPLLSVGLFLRRNQEPHITAQHGHSEDLQLGLDIQEQIHCAGAPAGLQLEQSPASWNPGPPEATAVKLGWGSTSGRGAWGQR